MVGRPKKWNRPIQKSITFEEDLLTNSLERFPDLSQKIDELLRQAIGVTDEEQRIALELEMKKQAVTKAQEHVQVLDSEVQTLETALQSVSIKKKAIQNLFADKLAFDKEFAINAVKTNLNNPGEARKLAGIWSTALKEKYSVDLKPDEILLLAGERVNKTDYIR